MQPSLPLQVETEQAALSQDVASQRSIRFLWTGFGIAVLVLIGFLACALVPLASHASATLFRLVPEVAFNPSLPSLGRAVLSGHASPRVAARTVQMGIKRKAPTGVEQTNGRMADILGQDAAGGGIFPDDSMGDSRDSLVPNLDNFKRKKDAATTAKPLREPGAAPPRSQHAVVTTSSAVQRPTGVRAAPPSMRGTAPRMVAQLLSPAAVTAEASLLELFKSSAPDGQIAEVIAQLQADGGLTDEPARSSLIEGTWELLHTSKSNFDPANPLGRRVDGSTPGIEGWFATVTGGLVPNRAASSSPIQRAVTGAFKVTQTLTALSSSRGRVEQLVNTPLGQLHLDAQGSPDASNGRRVNFAFDEGFFQSELGVRLPYPVPFKLLGKEAEGWLDTSYLSDQLRVSTGNKGTTFCFSRVKQA